MTSESVVRSYIKRIKEIQPILNCVAEDNFEEALKTAKEYDKLIESSDGPLVVKNKPFFGVPFSTKVKRFFFNKNFKENIFLYFYIDNQCIFNSFYSTRNH